MDNYDNYDIFNPPQDEEDVDYAYDIFNPPQKQRVVQVYEEDPIDEIRSTTNRLGVYVMFDSEIERLQDEADRMGCSIDDAYDLECQLAEEAMYGDDAW